ncbi:MAG: hypothetical protein ACRC33_07705, partial [Gemmataceae bacterium]
MSVPTCPHCDSRLTGPERRDGWCESCGKRLPSFARAAPRAAAAELPAGPSAWAVAGGVALALLGAALIALTLFGEPARRVGAAED